MGSIVILDNNSKMLVDIICNTEYDHITIVYALSIYNVNQLVKTKQHLLGDELTASSFHSLPYQLCSFICHVKLN